MMASEREGGQLALLRRQGLRAAPHAAASYLVYALRSGAFMAVFLGFGAGVGLNIFLYTGAGVQVGVRGAGQGQG